MRACKWWAVSLLGLVSCAQDLSPEISELQLAPQSIDQAVTTEMEASFAYANGEDDLSVVRVTIVEPTGDVVAPSEIPVTGLEGETGTVTVRFDVTFANSGEHQFEFVLQDDAMNNSNSLVGTVNVTP